MKTDHYHLRLYAIWAPAVARWLFAFVFLYSAYYKIPGSELFGMQVASTEAVGIPFPALAVTLAFILEVLASIALAVGWHTRLAAAALIVFVLLILVFFVRDFSDQTQLTIFFSCLELTAGLLYISVYGAEHVAIRKDHQPESRSYAFLE
jgi:putative oxidoreductase